MTVSNEDLNAYIEGNLKLSTTELHNIATELQRFRIKRDERKRIPKWHCTWCGKDRSTAPIWEQGNARNEWKPLCGYCARKRLNNPYNFLLNMRRIEVKKE